jgi:hypothetical protein
MLSDHSESFAESWRFLEREIKDILTVGKGINDVEILFLWFKKN